MLKKRTGGMTVIGVLNLVFGGLGIISALFEVLAALAGIRRAIVIEGFMGIPGISADQRAIMLKMLEFALFALAVSTVGVIAGIGIFRMRAWTRAASLIYAGLWALNAGILLFFPVQATTPDANVSATIIGRVVGICFSLSYPIILFTLFQKPNWKAAFARQPTS
jgi:hypothetical protein